MNWGRYTPDAVRRYNIWHIHLPFHPQKGHLVKVPDWAIFGLGLRSQFLVYDRFKI